MNYRVLMLSALFAGIAAGALAQDGFQRPGQRGRGFLRLEAVQQRPASLRRLHHAVVHGRHGDGLGHVVAVRREGDRGGRHRGRSGVIDGEGDGDVGGL